MAMTVDEALRQPGELVAAWDGTASDAEWVGIYAASDAGVKLLGHERTDKAGRKRRTDELTRRGIRIGETYGGEFVWGNDGRELVAWSSKQRLFAATQRAIKLRGETVPVASVTRVASWVDRFDLGFRGVGVERRGEAPVVLAEERDPTPSLDPTYNRDNLAIDAAWASALGRALAAWIGVPHDDQIP